MARHLWIITARHEVSYSRYRLFLPGILESRVFGTPPKVGQLRVGLL